MPNSFSEIVSSTLGLISKAFNNFGNMLYLIFVTFLRISPLPDEVDFLLVCLVLIWIISLIVRMFRGK